MMTEKFFLQPDVFAIKLQHSVITGDSGEDSFRIGVHKMFRSQVGGNEHGLSSEETFVNQLEQLR